MKSRIVDGIKITWQPLEAIFEWFGVVAQTRRQKIRTNLHNPSNTLLSHEMCHVRQQHFLRWKFMPKYLGWWLWLAITFRRAYEDHPMEKEAWALQKQYRGWEVVTKYSYKDYK